MVPQVKGSAQSAVHEELLDMLKEHIADTRGGRPDAEPQPFRRQVVWLPNALGFLALHLLAVYGLFLAFTTAKLLTFLWTVLLITVSGEGVTLGAHRLYSHKSFKAKPVVKLAIIILQTLASQNCLYIWVRDHRQHHKYSDTDADPHNASRGFFFSHIGWLMCRKHPEVIAKGKNIDMSDLEADPFVMFQKKYYKLMYMLIAVLIPVGVPIWLWAESPFVSLMVSLFTRIVVTLNITWLINSAAHKFGTKPFTKDILPVECWAVSAITLGECWHNYHHTFPWDYKAAELGQCLNGTAAVIELLERWGLAYDLRAATPAMVLHRVLKRGDGSHPLSGGVVAEVEESYEANDKVDGNNKRSEPPLRVPGQ